MWDPNGCEMLKELHHWTTPRVIEVKSDAGSKRLVRTFRTR